MLPQYVRGARRLPQLLASALRDRPEERAPSLRRPLLVLRGREDALCSADWAEQLAAAAPDGRVRTVPGAHNAPCTHPAQVADALREFAAVLARDPAAPGMVARPGGSTQAHPDPRSEMLHLSSGAHLEGDEELVYTAVDEGSAGGDGLYVADIAEATGLAEDRVRAVVDRLVGGEVLRATVADDQLGSRYVLGVAQ